MRKRPCVITTQGRKASFKVIALPVMLNIAITQTNMLTM